MTMLIEIADASVALGGRIVVRDASVRVARCALVALLGPNGAGKSSLLRAGLGLLPMQHGGARLFGADSRAMAPDLRARRAAYLPQQPQAAWPLRVEALVTLGRFPYGAPGRALIGEDKAAVEFALDACDLTALRDRPIDTLSGGERVRAHLARVLAQGAPLIVLDEPTAGLDPAQSIAIADILRAHAEKGGGALFSTHDVSLAARVASEVLLMREGAIIARGAPDAALTEENLQAAYGRAGRIVRAGEGAGAIFI